MAIVSPSQRRAFDASGNAYLGAQCFVYNAGTLVLATIYSNPALSVVSANPLTADANGIFAQFFGASGALYDITTKTAGGVVLQSELSVPALGSASTVIFADFTTSRFQARGAGGTTHVEAGDPTGDDIGGTMRLGGWNGTQADTITADAALFNVTGRAKEQGFKLPGVVRTENTSFSAVSSVDIPLTNDPTGVLVWDIDIIKLIFSATNNPAIQFSFDGGATFVATATYGSEFLASHDTTTTPGGSGGSSATSATIASGVTTPANLPAHLFMRVVTPNSGAFATTYSGRLQSPQLAATPSGPSQTTFAGYNTTGGRATHMRLLTGSGTMSGLYRVVPQRGFGET